MLGKSLVVSSEAEDKISCDPAVSLPDYTFKQQFLKPFDLSLYFDKWWKTSKNFYLHELKLLISSATLENRNILKNICLFIEKPITC